MVNFTNFFRFIRTVKFLKFTQVLGQIFYTIYTPTPNKKFCANRNSNFKKLYIAPAKNASINNSFLFSSINLSFNISNKNIWNKKNVDYLWLYNLHYFDYLNNKSSTKEICLKLINRWIKEHKFGLGWDPYPTSLRIVNWIKFCVKYSYFPQDVISSLSVQADHLYRYQEFHIDSNHLFTNGKSLFFAGNFFTGKAAEKWVKKGIELITESLDNDFLLDGGHSERSVMYHSIVLEDLLDIYNLVLSLDSVIYRKLKSKLYKVIIKAYSWLDFMALQNGKFPLFGDAAYGICLPPKKIYSYCRLLGINLTIPSYHFGFLPHSNYAKLKVSRNSFFYLTLDGPKPTYQPGHSHADSLSFELYVRNNVVLCDAGVGNYIPGPLRDYCRSTAAHNTLEIKNLNSSEAWGSFRFGRRAEVYGQKYIRSRREETIQASHNGYAWLFGKPIHKRICKTKKNKKTIEIIDRIESKEIFDFKIRFRAAPGLQWVKVKNLWHLISLPKKNCILRLQPNTDLIYEIEKGLYFPEFNKCEFCQVLVVRGSGNMQCFVSHKIVLA